MSGCRTPGCGVCFLAFPLLPDLFSPFFDYPHVDGIGRAYQRGKVPTLNGQALRADSLGPIIEFENLVGPPNGPALRESDWFDNHPLCSFFEARAADTVQWLRPDGRCGFIRADGITCDPALNSFKVDAHKAALAAHFGKAASLVVAAMGELIGNIVDHSEATTSGFVAFLTRERLVEFVVADRGIGALKSLRKSFVHERLSDHGAALTSMIENGVSRFGSDTLHGNGFRPIFERLADMSGHLRFRSGNYALSLDGRFGDKIKLQLAQKPDVQGFVAAVVCRIKQ